MPGHKIRIIEHLNKEIIKNKYIYIIIAIIRNVSYTCWLIEKVKRSIHIIVQPIFIETPIRKKLTGIIIDKTIK